VAESDTILPEELATVLSQRGEPAQAPAVFHESDPSFFQLGVLSMPEPDTPPTSLALEDLASNFPHIPPECGIALVQSPVLCLEGQGHASGVLLNVLGSCTTTFRLGWSMDVTEAMRRYWNDPEETVEQGAQAVSLVLLRSWAGLTVLERSRRGTGFDWWLAPADNLFQATARLEVSGMMRGSTRRLNGRLKARVTQTERSDPSGLTAYVAVVEFGAPRAKVVRR
jgi:hypothetical protein